MDASARTVSSDWAEKGDTFIGLSLEMEPHLKSLVDLIQEDFPWTPSPVYYLSRLSSQALNDEIEAANVVLDLQMAHLLEFAAGSGDSSVVAGGTGSRSTTPIPGLLNLHQSSGPIAPVLRISTPEILLGTNIHSISPSLARMSAAPGFVSLFGFRCFGDGVLILVFVLVLLGFYGDEELLDVALGDEELLDVALGEEEEERN